MENKTTDEQLYIVSLDNGIREEEPISVVVYNTFSDGSELVQLNNTVFGVLKVSNNPKTSYIDDYTIIRADIAELLDVDHEEVKRIVSDVENIGIFTSLNYSKDIETRISSTAVLNHMVNYIQKGIITGDEAMWLTTMLRKPYDATPVKNPEEIKNIIDLGLKTLKKEIELQSGMQFDEKLNDALRKNYLRMIIFDFLVGRKNRGVDYYLISKINEQGKPIWKDAYISPISVSNTEDKESIVPDKAYCLNNRLIDRESLIEVLFEEYYEEIRKMTLALNDAKNLYKDAISRIIYNNTDLDKGSTLETLINSNLDYINKKQEAKEKTLDNDQKMNKVERTMATQSLNVRVTTKLDLIQKKYPINPKDHPEIFEKKDKLDKDDIKLIIEEEKKKNGFASSVILISIISLICGIGIGIAYVLMTFGN